MSTQWETAKHCHVSLSVLAGKIRKTESGIDPTANSLAYVRGSEGRPTLVESLATREENRRRLSRLSHLREDPGVFAESSDRECQNNTWGESIHGGHDSPLVPSASIHPSQTNEQGMLTDTSSSQMDLQDTDATHLEGMNFDLNMVDLIEGANFDTLFDMIGPQLPSF